MPRFTKFILFQICLIISQCFFQVAAFTKDSPKIIRPSYSCRKGCLQMRSEGNFDMSKKTFDLFSLRGRRADGEFYQIVRKSSEFKTFTISVAFFLNLYSM